MTRSLLNVSQKTKEQFSGPHDLLCDRKAKEAPYLGLLLLFILMFDALTPLGKTFSHDLRCRIPQEPKGLCLAGVAVLRMLVVYRSMGTSLLRLQIHNSK